MEAGAAKRRLQQRLKSVGLTVEVLTPAAGVEAMFSFYAEDRADGCEIDADGDMLQFQWGTYDWGNGPAFEVNITRQFIVTDDEDDEPRQLSLTFRFEPSAAPPGEAAGNRWCPTTSELGEFRKYVTGTRALQAVGQRRPSSVELRFERI